MDDLSKILKENNATQDWSSLAETAVTEFRVRRGSSWLAPTITAPIRIFTIRDGPFYSARRRVPTA
jgi:hypothetical protein